MQILNQRRESLVKIWEVVLRAGEIIPVPIPEAVTHRHYSSARFYEAPGDKKLFIHARSGVALHLTGSFAVALPNLWIFLAEVKGFKETTGGEKIKCLLLKGV